MFDAVRLWLEKGTLRSMTKLSLKKARFIYAFIAIPVMFYFVMVIVPVFVSLFYSLFDWSGGTKMTFIGIDNYKRLLNDTDFWRSFKNTCIFTLYMVLGQVGIALIFTLFMTMKWVRFKKVHRFLMFLPSILSAVVTGLVWQLIFNRDVGLLNYLLRFLHLENLIRLWLDDPKIVLNMASIPVVWQFVGYYMTIMASSVSSIPTEIFESAELEGAAGFKRTVYITIPLIAPTIGTCAMLSAIGSMKAFDHIMVMTGGGPGTTSMVMGLYAYNQTFKTQSLGYGNALAIGMLFITIVLVLPVLLARRKKLS